MAGVRAAIFNEQGELLLVRHAYGRRDWNVPGGGIEQSESPIAAAVREVWEETGLRVRASHLIGLYSIPVMGNLTSFFHMETVEGGAVGNADPAEVTDIGWFPLDRLPELMHPAVRAVLDDAFAGRRGGVTVLEPDGTIIDSLPGMRDGGINDN